MDYSGLYSGTIGSGQYGNLIPDETDDAVDSPSLEYRRMERRWELLHDLLGGTLTMREAEHKWLPQEPREEYASYHNRLRRSFLFNAYGDTVEKLTSKPFSRPVVAQGSLPAPIDSMLDDMDMAGTNLTQFARQMFRSAIVYGLTHVLVDFPKSQAQTLDEERRTGTRPVFIHISPTQLIGCKHEISPSGGMRLKQVRIKETRVETVGEFGETEVEYVRVISDTDYQLYRKDYEADGSAEGDYRLVEEGQHTFGDVPLITYYINRNGYMSATPPLEDLAFMNLAHWQSMSDQRNILRFARVGLLFAAGFSDEEMEEGIAIGPNQLIRSTNENAKMQYVEHDGKAISSGQEDLSTLETRMEVLGMQPLVQSSSGVQTATGKAIDESRTHSAIQAWIRSLENSLTAAFRYAARWMNLEVPTDFTVEVFNDFGISLRAEEDVKNLILIRSRGDISQDTFLREIKRRGVISDNLDIEAEIETASAESSASSMAGFDDGRDELDEPEPDDSGSEPTS